MSISRAKPFFVLQEGCSTNTELTKMTKGLIALEKLLLIKRCYKV